jgi:integrase
MTETGVESAKSLQPAGRFPHSFRKTEGKEPLDLASVLKKKIQPAFKRIGITGVSWHTFRHTVGTMLAEMGEHH